MQDDWSTLIRKLPIWVIYRWYFIETNAVYIGLTSCYERRIDQEYKQRKASLVKDYLESSGCTFTITRLHTRLTGSEASKLERLEIARHKQAGYTVLNKNNGGALGRYSGLTESALISMINTCHTCKEFRTRYPREYRSIHYHGWTHLLHHFPDYVQRHIRTRRYIQSLSDEKLYQIAYNCKTRSEFKNRHTADYNETIRRGLYSQFERTINHWQKTTHKSSITLRSITESDIRHKASLCASKRKFKETYYSEYSEALRRNIIDDLFKPRIKAVQLSDDDIIAHARQSGSPSKFRKQHPGEYREAVKRGIQDRINIEVPPLRLDIKHTYTYDELCDIVKTCKNRTEFKTSYRVAYDQAYRSGIYHDIIQLIPKQTGHCHKN